MRSCEVKAVPIKHVEEGTTGLHLLLSSADCRGSSAAVAIIWVVDLGANKSDEPLTTPKATSMLVQRVDTTGMR
jgi:hypothetical protein